VSTNDSPAYPTSSASNSVSGAPGVPSRVNIAFWLYIAAAAISLIALIVSLSSVDALRTSLQNQLDDQGTSVDAASLDAAVTAAVTASVIFGLLYLAAYVLFAFLMRRGANWARIVLLIITALSLLDVLSGYGLGAVRVILGIIATVLVFTAPANAYFTAVKSAKANRT
jgi:K+-sensing histidine kinase KdpD